MDYKVFTQLNIYDQLAYILVGGIGLLYLWVALSVGQLVPDLPGFEFPKSLVWLLVAYYYGHIVQSLANTVVRENKSVFTEFEKRVLNQAAEHYKVVNLAHKEIFNLAYQDVLSGKNAGHLIQFIGNYGLYRGCFVLNVIQCLVVFGVLIYTGPNLEGYAILAFFVGVSYLFYKRKNRFFMYIRQKVIQNTALLLAEEFGSNNKPA